MTFGVKAGLTAAARRYLDLESMEVVEELLELYGAELDARALPVLSRRLAEEQQALPGLESRGYVRMAEKSVQLVAGLEDLISELEVCQDGPEA